jgi:hypothetical protein
LFEEAARCCCSGCKQAGVPGKLLGGVVAVIIGTPEFNSKAKNQELFLIGNWTQMYRNQMPTTNLQFCLSPTAPTAGRGIQVRKNIRSQNPVSKCITLQHAFLFPSSNCVPPDETHADAVHCTSS